jgi:transcriptional regulator with XRE-family HTH domain
MEQATLSTYVQQLRNDRGWTLRDTAAHMGRGDHTVLSRIEAGKRTPSTVVIHELAMAFAAKGGNDSAIDTAAYQEIASTLVVLTAQAHAGNNEKEAA